MQIYIYKVLKQVHADTGITSKGMMVRDIDLPDRQYSPERLPPPMHKLYLILSYLKFVNCLQFPSLQVMENLVKDLYEKVRWPMGSSSARASICEHT